MLAAGRGGRDATWPTSPTNSSNATGRPRHMAPGNCTVISGPAVDWPAHLLSGRPGGLAGSGLTPRPTAGWTPFTHWRRAQELPATPSPGAFWPDRPRDRLPNKTGTPSPLRRRLPSRPCGHNRACSGYAPRIGSPWLTAFAQHSPFMEKFQLLGQTVRHKQIPAELVDLPWRGMARPAAAATR